MNKTLLAVILAAGCTAAHALPERWEWQPGQEPGSDRPKTMVAALPRSTTDRPDEHSGSLLHVMYVLPSDGVDDHHDTNGKIGTSVTAFNNWLSGQTPGRAFRIDTYQGLPDITFFRLSRTDAQMRATNALVRSEIESDLRAAGMIDDGKLYAVYYGGSSNYACGGGAYPPTLPGNVGAMYLNGEPPNSIPCNTNPLGAGVESPGYIEFAMLHELMHTLGFVAACAPHQVLSGHVSDNANDLMWAGNAPWQLPPLLDIGRDDYYQHSTAGCLDFSASSFLHQPSNCSNDACANLSLSHVNAPTQSATGRDVIYRLSGGNAGPVAASGVSLTDVLPSGTTFIWASPNCSHASGTVTCALGTMAVGAQSQVNIVVRPVAAGVLTNTAAISAGQLDPDSANNQTQSIHTASISPAANAVQRYRLYSNVTKEHHFTTDLNEYNVLGTFVGTWAQEGTVGKVLDNPGSFGGVGAVPYYRLYDNSTRWHHWTTDANEYYTLGFVYSGWNMEGVDGWILPASVAGSTQLYRLNYPALGSLHHWTIDANEYNTLIAQYGWVGEGGAGFVIQ